MKAIILAAGKGSRISDDIGPIPKSMLEINGEPIIRTTAKKLSERNINIAVCTGYRSGKICEALHDFSITYFHNPFFDVTNNIASLWFARSFMADDDCILISADVVFDDYLLDKVIHEEGQLVMATDSSRINDGDYFFALNSGGLIVKYGPDVPVEERACEYVGISKVNADTIPEFKHRLNNMVESGNYTCYWENVFFTFIGDEKYSLKTVDVAGSSWREIDRIEDYRKAVDQFTRKGVQA